MLHRQMATTAAPAGSIRPRSTSWPAAVGPGVDVRRTGIVDVVLSTTLTEIRDGELRYRGHDAVELVASSPFEDVAELLWTGPADRAGALDGARQATSALVRSRDRSAGRGGHAGRPHPGGDRGGGVVAAAARRPASRVGDPPRPHAVGHAGRGPAAGPARSTRPLRRPRDPEPAATQPRLRRPAVAQGGPGGPQPGPRCGPSTRRSSCWPTTSWPAPPSPPGSRPRPGPTPTTWCCRARRGERAAARRGRHGRPPAADPRRSRRAPPSGRSARPSA